MDMMRTISIFSLLLLVLAACTSPAPAPVDTEDSDDLPSVDDLPEEVAVDDLPDDPEEVIEALEEGSEELVKEFTIKSRNWEFEPSTITVNQGDTVRLTLESEDIPHGFLIAEYGIAERIEPGSPVEVEFVADLSGNFMFRCSVPCGAGHSQMKGELVVN